jgi:hypothetical protein
VDIGDTFLWQPPRSTKPHLFIVISHPSENAGRFVIINLTESRHGNWSAVLHRGQHGYIYKDSDVNFIDAEATTEAKIEEQRQKNCLWHHDEPMDLRIVQQIMDISRRHPAFNGVLRRYLPRDPVADLTDLDPQFRVAVPSALSDVSPDSF